MNKTTIPKDKKKDALPDKKSNEKRYKYPKLCETLQETKAIRPFKGKGIKSFLINDEDHKRLKGYHTRKSLPKAD